jgi:hypothetical protein
MRLNSKNGDSILSPKLDFYHHNLATQTHNRPASILGFSQLVGHFKRHKNSRKSGNQKSELPFEL